jgi:hypothetical protein
MRDPKTMTQAEKAAAFDKIFNTCRESFNEAAGDADHYDTHMAWEDIVTKTLRLSMGDWEDHNHGKHL